MRARVWVEKVPLAEMGVARFEVRSSDVRCILDGRARYLSALEGLLAVRVPWVAVNVICIA